jgi:uncharacterized protein (TIGR02271 family)
MPTIEDIKGFRGHEARGSDGDKLGKIEDIYLDRETSEPEWIAIKTGLFGSHLSFVPLAEARLDGDAVTVPYDKDKVKEAPRVEPDGELSHDEEARLYRHYGLDYGEGGADWNGPEGAGTGHDVRDRDISDRTGRSGDPTPDGSPGVVGNDVSGPETDQGMTRSEEELQVGTARREAGRARLRKYVVTEGVQETVPVQREEVRVEREPITDANVDRALDGPEISEEEHEVVLHSEEAVAEKRAVPKERVRLDKDVVTDEQTVSDEVRQERIDVEGDRA